MSDMVDDYHEKVVKLLSSETGEPPARLAEVLCLPSFHPEALLQVAGDSSNAALRLATFASSFWYSGPGPSPSRVEESAPVPPERAARFWDDVDALDPQAIRDSTNWGLDGMFTQCSWRRDGAAASFKAWSPAPDSQHGAFIRLVYDLAWELARERSSVERLEQLHGYLCYGLPLRWIDGEPPRLRIFGGLTSRDEIKLRSFLGSLPAGAPVVVDMTNFDGMGALLHSVFVKFASARRVAWVVSETSRRAVSSMKLTDPELFDRVEDAAAWIARDEAGHGSVAKDPNGRGRESSPT